MKYALKSGVRLGTGIAARLLAVAAMACCCAAHGVDNGNRPVRGGDWKVVYSSAEGPQGRALEVLTERLTPHLLREQYLATQHVLPMERAGTKLPREKKHRIVVGMPSENPVLRDCLKGAVPPEGGYLIRAGSENGANTVLIAGATPEAVLWGTFEFLDVTVPDLEWQMFHDPHLLYAGTLFRTERALPKFEVARRPETPIRSIFAWGQVIDDYRSKFREMARARFNRAIIWNKWQVINAKDVVDCAHSWGVKVYWGFAWGWGDGWEKTDVHNLDKLADRIVDEWRRVWKPMGGDGIYFQSFTETTQQELNGRSIAEAVTELVNMVTKRIHAESPDLKIVFGLHANSIRKPGATEAIAKTDPSLEILWENCGGFPFGDVWGNPDTAFCDKIVAMSPSVGLSWKAQLRLDWATWVEPCGPFVLGCAGQRTKERDQRSVARRGTFFDEVWMQRGKVAYDFVRHMRAGQKKPVEFNGVAEYTPPYGFTTQCQAELFWSTEDAWEEIMRRARARARPEW